MIGFGRRKDGSELAVEISQNRIGDQEHGLVLVTIRDRTEWSRAQESLYQQKEQAVVTLVSIGEGIVTTDQAGRVIFINPVAERLTGWRAAEALGQPLDNVLMLIDDSTRLPIESMAERALRAGRVVDMPGGVLLVRRDGTEVAVSDTAAPITDRNGATIGAVIVFHDITENRRVAHRLSHSATHDDLTGLVNRAEFERRLTRVVTDAAGDDRAEHVLCAFDLDGFKAINDTDGHEAGDALLKEISTKLSGEMRRRDTFARLGGDEFAALLEHCSMVEAQQIAEKLRGLVHDLGFTWNGTAHSVGVSIGVVPIRSNSGRMATVMRAADEACYAAKEAGGNQVHVDHLRAPIRQVLDVDSRRVTRLTRAVAEGRFEFYAQTIAPLEPEAPGRPRFELQLRLPDERGGLLTADSFVPQAERYNLMASIDRWTVTNLTRMLGEWRRGHADCVLPFCAIKLSGSSLTEEFVGTLKRSLEDNKVPAEALCFEINESVAASNFAHAAHIVAQVRSTGCKVALGGFGGSMTSFTFLKALPVDFVKFGGHYVRGVADDPVNGALVRAISDIGELMGIATIAEDVDSVEALDALRTMGVAFTEGNAVSRATAFSDSRGILAIPCHHESPCKAKSA